MPHDPYKALYLHIPFCVKRCAYCDFATQAIDRASVEIDEYIENLSLELRRTSKEGKLASIETVYLGGGTPSYVGAKRLSLLLYTLSLSMRLEPDVECTMEANPESIDERLIADIWALGVNRLSLGVQSFDDGELEALGRVHSADDARRAIVAAQSRFDNVSIDLMAGIPRQDLASFEKSLREAIRLGVNHVSVYPLTIEEHTLFNNMVLAGTMEAPDEDLQADAMELAAEVLGGAGFHRYEVASYARRGYECRHNKAYWTGVPYVGLGRSAVTMTQNSERRMRVQDGRVIEELDRASMLVEDLMLGMRMSRGVSESALKQATELVPEATNVFQSLEELGLVRHIEGRWMPTDRGWLLGNELYGRIYDLTL